MEWKEYKEHPKRFLRFYKYFRLQDGDKTFYQRLPRYKWLPSWVFKWLIMRPCYHKNGFYMPNGDKALEQCRDCGAYKEVIDNWKNSDRLYLGNGIVK